MPVEPRISVEKWTFTMQARIYYLSISRQLFPRGSIFGGA